MGLNYTQVNLGGVRAEKIDTRRALLVAEALADFVQARDLNYLCEVLDIPMYNEVSRKTRALEMLAVWEYYPRELIELAFRSPPPWHLLIRPPRWEDVDREEVAAYLLEEVNRRGSWPSIDVMQVRFGRASNHRPDAAKTPGQEQFGVEA